MPAIYEDTFYGYARRWFESINHGGAFEMSNSTFDFFLAVEEYLANML